MFYADSEAVEKKLTNCVQKVTDPNSVEKIEFPCLLLFGKPFDE
jgi:hypothetical protein